MNKINECFTPGHFYSVIPNITKDYNNNNTKFINIDFNEVSQSKCIMILLNK